MTPLQVSNVQTELDIIVESIDLFQAINFYPSTYEEMVARYIEIVCGD